VTALPRRSGQDRRIVVTLRSALESLIESLDATVRVARSGPAGEAIPEPLRRSAAQLQERLGSANRLAGSRFIGSPDVIATCDAIREAIQDLDAAFVAYRKRAEGPGQREDAAVELDATMVRIKRDAHRWD